MSGRGEQCTITVSLFPEDDNYLDALVEELKGKGAPSVTRSSVVRAALRVVDFEALTEAMKKKRF